MVIVDLMNNGDHFRKREKLKIVYALSTRLRVDVKVLFDVLGRHVSVAEFQRS